MTTPKLSRLALGLVIALGVTACGSDGGTTASSGGNSGTNNGGAMVLAPVQSTLSNVLTGVGAAITSVTPTGTPLDIGGFVAALAPTLNDLINGPDATLTGLLNGIQTILNNPTSPTSVTTAASQIQAGITALAPAITSLAQNLPCALGTLVRQQAIVCTGTSPATQLQNLIALFSSGANPFAGTPLAALGTLGGTGTPSGGPTGTPLDVLLKPLVSALGVPGGASPLPVNGALVDQIGTGLATVGTQIISAYSTIPNSGKIPVAGQLVATLGYTLADLGTTLQTLQTGTAVNVGSTVGNALINLNNLLTAPTGLLGALAAASGQSSLITTVATGNTQVNTGIAQLITALNATLLNPVDTVALQPVLNALAPLTCALTLFGNCNGVTTTGSTTSAGGTSATAGLTALTNALTSLLSGTPASSLLSTLTSALTSASTSNGNLISTLTNAAKTLPTVPSSGGTGNTGLLGGLLGLL